MIYNQQIAQSYVLLTALRSQKDRIQKKLNTTEHLKFAIAWMEDELQKKCIQVHQNSQIRKQIIILLRNQLTILNNKRNIIEKSVEMEMMELRKNLNEFRNMREVVIQEKKYGGQLERQSDTLCNRSQEVDYQIQKFEEEQKECELQKPILINQQQIMKGKIRQLAILNEKIKQKYTSILCENKIFENSVKKAKQCNIQLINELEGMVGELDGLNKQNCRNGQELGIIQLRQCQLEFQASDSQREHNLLLAEYEAISQKILEKQCILNKVSQKCRTINGEIIMASASCDILQRGLRFRQNQIECLKLLTNKLYNWKCQLGEYQRYKNEERERNADFSILEREKLDGWGKDINQQVNFVDFNTIY